MNDKYDIKRKDLLFPELSFKITGILFDVSNKLGAGHKEKYYEKAISIALNKAELKFTEQKYVPLNYNNEIVGKYFLDFLIEDKIILELKQGKFVPAQIIEQTKHYLTSLNLQLALIACFTHSGVIIKRIINLPNQHS